MAAVDSQDLGETHLDDDSDADFEFGGFTLDEIEATNAALNLKGKSHRYDISDPHFR